MKADFPVTEFNSSLTLFRIKNGVKEKACSGGSRRNERSTALSYYLFIQY